MLIGVVSLNQVWENKIQNLILCEEYMKESSRKNIDLLIFPEMTLTGFSTNIEQIAEDGQSSKTIAKFQKLAKTYKVSIVFGIVIKEEKKALNKAIFIDYDGKILERYSKIHPFTFSGENLYFNGGNQLSKVDFMNHTIGLTICYDLRFPELYTALAKKSDIIINIANWPKKRINHWHTLLKERAIENQLFIIGVNRIGVDNNSIEYEESSNIYNANGEILEYGSFKNMKIFIIDKENTNKFRSKFNTIHDRKVDLYKEII